MFDSTPRLKSLQKPLLLIEQLESRLTPANLVVTNPFAGGIGSLAFVIGQANSTVEADTITFRNNVRGTITFGAFTISESTTIIGPGADQLTLSGDLNIQMTNSFFNGGVALDRAVNISGLTLDSTIQVTNGTFFVDLDGDGFFNDPANGGTNTFTLDKVIVQNRFGLELIEGSYDFNGTNGAFRQRDNFVGRGAEQTFNVSITNSTFNNNIDRNLTLRNTNAAGTQAQTLVVNGGGAISTYASVDSFVITNSTFSRNTAVGSGGAILFQSVYGIAQNNTINATISNSTIVLNTADTATSLNSEGGGIGILGGAGNPDVDLTLNSDLIALNTIRGGIFLVTNDVQGLVNSSSSFNLIGTDGFDINLGTTVGLSGIANGVNNNQIGFQGAEINPGIDLVLRANGAFIPTHAVQAGSAAIDRGNNPLGLLTDQRGFPRASGFFDIFNPLADVGAYELFQPVPATTPQPTIFPPKFYAIGADRGAEGRVIVYNADDTVRFSLLPYGAAWRGGVRVAVGDYNADGVDDYATATGAGGGPHVKLFDGLNGVEVASFFAYDSNFSNGVYIAMGDVDGDGRAEIVTGAGDGGASHVKVFSSSGTLLASFFAFDPSLATGVRVATGDLDGDGKDEIITAGGPGTQSIIFNYRFDGTLYSAFLAYAPSFTGGVFVAAGDFNGDGKDDIVTSVAIGASHIQVIDAISEERYLNFFAYDLVYTGGARVATTDRDLNGISELLVVSGTSSSGHFKRFNVDGTLSDTFFAFDFSFSGGAFIG
jgi:predicted outer membrane repeat protein